MTRQMTEHVRNNDAVSLAAAIDRYVASLEGAGYSPHTLKAYSTRLTDFLNWISNGERDDGDDATGSDDGRVAAALQPSDVIQTYLAMLRRRPIGRRVGVSAQTLAHAYAVLSGFYRWAERILRLEPNPMRDVLKPRTDSSVDDEFKSLTSAQLDALFDVARNGWSREDAPPDLRSDNRRIEDWLLVAFMGLAGLRVSEVCSLDRSDIVEDVVQVIGKGRKRRSVPLAPEIIEMLDSYTPPPVGQHLFGRPTQPERRLAPYAVEQRIPRLARRAGIIELRVTPHVLRHTFGSLMLAADPTALIPTRDLMGHESVETTNKYAHTREEARRLALISMHEARKRG